MRENMSGIQINKSYRNFYNKRLRGIFKIQSGLLNCYSRKVLYLLKCKVCCEAPYVRKAKIMFRYRLTNCKNKHRAFRKGNRKISLILFHDCYRLDSPLGIHDWALIIFEQFETHKQLRETFWQHRLKAFYPLGLIERKIFNMRELDNLFWVFFWNYSQTLFWKTKIKHISGSVV